MTSEILSEIQRAQLQTLELKLDHSYTSKAKMSFHTLKGWVIHRRGTELVVSSGSKTWPICRQKNMKTWSGKTQLTGKLNARHTPNYLVIIDNKNSSVHRFEFQIKAYLFFSGYKEQIRVVMNLEHFRQNREKHHNCNRLFLIAGKAQVTLLPYKRMANFL